MIRALLMFYKGFKAHVTCDSYKKAVKFRRFFTAELKRRIKAFKEIHINCEENKNESYGIYQRRFYKRRRQ